MESVLESHGQCSSALEPSSSPNRMLQTASRYDSETQVDLKLHERGGGARGSRRQTFLNVG